MPVLIRVHHPVQKFFFRRKIKTKYPNDKILDSRVGLYYAGDDKWLLGVMHPVDKIRFLIIGFTNKRIILKSTQSKVFFGWNIINYIRPFALVALGLAVFVEFPFVVAAGAALDALIISISRPFEDEIQYSEIINLEITEEKATPALVSVKIYVKTKGNRENFTLYINNRLNPELILFLKSKFN
jgi:hypothetical protein